MRPANSAQDAFRVCFTFVSTLVFIQLIQVVNQLSDVGLIRVSSAGCPCSDELEGESKDGEAMPEEAFRAFQVCFAHMEIHERV